MRRITILALLAALVMAMALPVQAEPPERVEDPWFIVFLDVENDLVVFWNISRDELCAWAEGPPPFDGPPPVIEPVTLKVHETADGAVVASFQEERPLELWNLDEDAPLTDPCSDTAGQAEPWATGDAMVSMNDNDLFNLSDTRVNSFGDRGQGTVTDTDGGNWHYSWTFRAHCDVDCMLDFDLKVDKPNLKKKGK